MDGDGDLDIVVVKDAGQDNQIFINDINSDGSTGIFTDSGQLLGANDSQSVALGDVDGDGDLDMVVVNAGLSKQNRVYINDINNDGSAGIFTDSGQLLGANDSQSVMLGDVNGDGDLDMVVANTGLSKQNRVYINDINNDGNAGTFTDSGQLLGANDSQSVALGDVDGDGDLDMVVANTGVSKQNRVFINVGLGAFTDSGQLLGANDSQSVVLGDVDGDADLDTVVVNGGIQGGRVYLGSLSGS